MEITILDLILSFERKIAMMVAIIKYVEGILEIHQ